MDRLFGVEVYNVGVWIRTLLTISIMAPSIEGGRNYEGFEARRFQKQSPDLALETFKIHDQVWEGEVEADPSLLKKSKKSIIPKGFNLAEGEVIDGTDTSQNFTDIEQVTADKLNCAPEAFTEFEVERIDEQKIDEQKRVTWDSLRTLVSSTDKF